jgi:hypothetical protein
MESPAAVARGLPARLFAVPETEHFFFPGVRVGHAAKIAHLDRPVTIETLSMPGESEADISAPPAPRVFRVRNFLSLEEREHLVGLAQRAGLRPSVVSNVKMNHASSVRTSETAWIGKNFGVPKTSADSPTVDRIIARSAALLGLPAHYVEGVSFSALLYMP